jgi:hypothetical protein
MLHEEMWAVEESQQELYQVGQSADTVAFEIRSLCRVRDATVGA